MYSRGWFVSFPFSYYVEHYNVQYFMTFLKGCVIGIANIIPGVSGGTMALVLGLYERLIEALHKLGPETVRELLPLITFKKPAIERAKAELARIDFWFLACLSAGAGVTIVATARLITFLLEEKHDPTYGFFCGLILVSVIVPLQMMKKRYTSVTIVTFIIGAGLAVALGMSMIGPQQADKERKKDLIKGKVAVEQTIDGVTSKIGIDVKPKVDHSFPRLCFLFFAGAVAISAMILPGISGSFMLLVMNAYFDILAAISQRDIVVIGAVGAGAALGLLGFTRVLNFVLKRWHDETMTFLAGLMIGSLFGLWPFREFEMVGLKKVYTSQRMPEMGANLYLTIATFIIGGAIVYGFILYEKRKGKPAA